MELDGRDRITVLAHYYRAMVGRADIWRTRMDATTNWAIGATAAVVSFALGSPELPHFGIYVATFLTGSFLFLEARRLTFYHLWQTRVLALEQGLVRPAVGEGIDDDELAARLEPHLGRTVPTMPVGRAVARRLRRIYLTLFAVQLLTWVYKLASHPEPVGSLGALLERARLGFVPGSVVAGATLLLFALACGLALLRGGIDRVPD